MRLINLLALPAILMLTMTIGGCFRGYECYDGPPPLKVSDLHWLTGDWSTAPEGDIAATEEHWTTPSSGIMFGIGRTLKDEKEVFIEYLRIAADGDNVIYYAAPGGRLPATPFRAVECSEHRAVFENLEHDYPQRIIYELQEDGTIKARIEGDVNGEMKSSEWRFYPTN